MIQLKRLIPLTFLVANSVQAETVAPKIISVNVTPTSAPVGTMFKFTAKLNAPLITGNKVKIDFGKGLASMTGTKTSYSLSRAIYTIGSQTYKVGIYNAKNALQGKISSGNYTVSSSTNNPPTLTLVNGKDSAEPNKVYTLQLKATDIDNNLRSITVDWKDGSTVETQSAINDETLIFTHTYTTVGKFTLSATAKDNGRPASTSKPLSKTIDVVERSYSKICNSGALEGEEDCPLNPVLGNKKTDWACTKDNNTGLIWEVKTDDGGLRDMNKTYNNLTELDSPVLIDGKFVDYQSSQNAHGFVLNVNGQNLCGANNWRIPTSSELLTIVSCSSGKYKSINTNSESSDWGEICDGYNATPAINSEYFPDIKKSDYGFISGSFWTSTPLYADFNGGSMRVIDFAFYNKAYYTLEEKKYFFKVRLVRSDN